MSMEADIKRVMAQKVVARSQELCKAVALELYKRITANSLVVGLAFGSPVLTGRYYTSHNISLNTINKSTREINEEGADSPYKGLTLSNASLALSSFRIGDTVFIANSLPYAQRIEDGWSKLKAPEGVYAVAAEQVIAKFKGSLSIGVSRS